MPRRIRNDGRFQNHHIFDGKSYCFEKQVGDTCYFHCQRLNDLQCPGRCKTVLGVFKLTRRHRHPSNDSLENLTIFKNELFQACTKQYLNLPMVYQSIALMHPESAAQIHYKNIVAQMRTWRKYHMNLPIVNSPHEFKNVLYSNEYSQLRWYGMGHSITISLHLPYTPQEAVVMSDPSILEFVQDASSIYICILPLRVRQLDTSKVVVVGAVKSNHIFPCFWICMNDNSTECYESILSEVIHAIPTPTIVVANFCSNLRQALNRIYPNCDIKGSFQCYCNAIHQKVQDLEFPDDDNSAKIIKKLMALALLPADRILGAFYSLQQSLPANVLPIYSPLFNFIEEVWLRRVGTNELSCCNNLDAITNCQRVMFNFLNNTVGSDTSIWRLLTDVIHKINEYSFKHISKIEDGKKISGTTLVRSLIHNPTIQKQWDAILSGGINSEKFLASGCFLLMELFDYIKFTNQSEVMNMGILHDIGEAANIDIQFEQMVEVFAENNPNHAPDVDHNYVLAPNNERMENHVINNDVNIQLKRGDIAQVLEQLRNNSKDSAECDLTCVACKIHTSKYAVEPCSHFVLCHDCLIEFLQLAINEERSFLNCPVCRTKITDIRRMYFPS